MEGVYWEIDETSALTAPVRAALTTRYGYTADPTHTHAALVSIRHASLGSVTCLDTFAYSLRAQDWTGNAAGLEDAIETEVRARLRDIRNAAPITSIVGRRHWL